MNEMHSLEKNYVLILVKLLLILMCIDFSGDFLINYFIDEGVLKDVGDLVRNGIVLVLSLTILIGFSRLSSLQSLSSAGIFCLGIIGVIFLCGLILGLMENNQTNVFREASVIGPIFLIPLLIGVNKKHIYSIAKYLLYLVTIVLGLKIVISQLAFVAVFDSLTSKVLLRLSPILLLPYCYFLFRVLTKPADKMNLMFLLVVIIEILIAQSRGLNLAILLVTFFTILSYKNIKKSLLAFSVIGIAVGIVMFFTDKEPSTIFGNWSGDNFENTVNVRLQQVDLLIDRLYHRPLTGYGFGYFTPNTDYANLELPYTLELDLLNFFSKIGIPLSLLYVFSYILIVWQYVRIHFSSYKNKSITISYLAALLSLLFFSLTQTTHSSYVYWIIYALTFLLVFKHESVGSKRSSPRFATNSV